MSIGVGGGDGDNVAASANSSSSKSGSDCNSSSAQPVTTSVPPATSVSHSLTTNIAVSQQQQSAAVQPPQNSSCSATSSISSNSSLSSSSVGIVNAISTALQNIITSDNSDTDTEVFPPPRVTDLSESDEESVSEVRNRIVLFKLNNF